MDFSKLKSLVIPEGVVNIITRDGVVLWRTKEIGLPSAYQEVTYLFADADVASYIDLGFTFDTAAEIYLTQIVPNGAVTSYPFGAVENNGAYRCCLSSPYSGVATLYGYNGTTYSSTQVKFNGIDTVNEFKMILKKDQRDIINLTTGASGVWSAQVEYSMTSNMYLFAQNYNGSPRFGSTRIISAFKYYDKNGDLVCDLIPCYRKSDSVRGMYDLVRKIFLTNVGTGEDFSIGQHIYSDINGDEILLNLDRKHLSSYTSGTGWSDNGVYLNPASYSTTNPLAGNPCTISNLTSNSITVTEPGNGGYGVAYGLLVHNAYGDNAGKSYILTWDATGTTNTRFRLMVCDGTNLTYVPLDHGDGTITSATFSISKGGQIITINDVDYTFTNRIKWIAFHFSSATGTTTSYRNVKLVENEVINQVPISINADGSIYNDGLGYKNNARIRSSGDELSYATEEEAYVCTGFIPFKKGDTIYIHPPFYGGNADNAINLCDSNFTNLGQFTDTHATYGVCTGYSNYKATTENSITSFTLTDEHNGSDDVAYVRITHSLGKSSNIPTGKQLYVQVDNPFYTNLAVPSGTNTTDWNIWCNDARMTSGTGGAYEQKAGIITTNYIKASVGDVIRVKGLSAVMVGYPFVGVFNSNKDILAQGVNNLTIMQSNGYISDIKIDGDLLEFKLAAGDVSYIRLSSTLTSSLNNVIITVNEEIADNTSTSINLLDMNNRTIYTGYTADFI